MFWTSDALAVY